MNNKDQDDMRDRLHRELSEAYDGFRTELEKVVPQWGFWVVIRRSTHRIFGPYTPSRVAGIYRGILLILFSAGVVLSVISGVTQGLGVALVVGSLFAFGSWMSQAWFLSREEQIRIRDELLGELTQREIKHYAAVIKDITDQIRELDKQTDTMAGDGQ